MNRLQAYFFCNVTGETKVGNLIDLKESFTFIGRLNIFLYQFLSIQGLSISRKNVADIVIIANMSTNE